VTAADLQELAQAHLDGIASDGDVRILEANEDGWVDALEALRVDVLKTIARLGSTLTGPERDIVLGDFTDELERIDAMLTELTGEAPAPPAPVPTPDSRTGGRDVVADRKREEERRRRAEQADDEASEDDDEDDEDEDDEPGTAQLQLTLDGDQVIAWIGGHNAETEPAETVLELLTEVGAGKAWEARDPIPLPTGQHAQALSAPLRSTLGWLVSLGSTAGEERFGASVTWLGIASGLAVRLVGHGRVVPQLEKLSNSGKGDRSTFAVRWVPTLIDHEEYSALTKSLPGVVHALEKSKDPRVVTRDILTAFVDAICREAASRLEVPAPPPHPRSTSDVAEAVLGRLEGTTFEAPNGSGTEVSRRLQRWAKGVTGASKLSLSLQLDPPDDSDAWYLKTLVSDGNRKEQKVEPAMSRASDSRRDQIKRELERLEGLYTPLERGKHKRRGEVILSQEEAWDLMTHMGPNLQAAGFEVRVPPLSPKKATPSLRVTSTGSKETQVGAQQLTAVRWTAVFDDVELTVDDIQRLSQEARPLVKSHGKWVAVDHADLEAAAEALRERAEKDQMSGAAMLRYALGLEDSPLPGGVSVAGDSWAANLLRSATEIPEEPPRTYDEFDGTLRAYQADAAAWLDFLDAAGLGGCLALDMGLGKTPTMLAHLARTTERGPALVIAPPAVVGNWASEAKRFTPDLDVVVHHGANRADEDEVAGEVADADVLLTTYGTAVRDIEALTEVQWGKIVLDEAQVIKNPASETAQQLRRLEAHNRVVLTGTPIENGLGDLWALMDFVNPGLLGDRSTFIAQLSKEKAGKGANEQALRTLNGVLVFRRTKAEPAIAEELPDRIDELDHCPMTAEQIGLYQAVLDDLTVPNEDDGKQRKGAVLAAITALKQICNHPSAYTGDDGPLAGRSGKLARLEEILDSVFESEERVLIFTHFASWGERLAKHLSARYGMDIGCYHGGLSRGARDKMVQAFQEGEGAGALVLSLKAGGTGLNLTAASHVVLYDRWWNPAVEDQARDRAWRIGQTKTVVAHRLVCPGTVDERVEEVVQGKRRIADIVLPKSSSVGDLDQGQLQKALGIDPATVLRDVDVDTGEAA
jgi:hypothetical protein